MFGDTTDDNTIANEVGVYSVRLWDVVAMNWCFVIVDDLLPLKKSGQLMFANTRSGSVRVSFCLRAAECDFLRVYLGTRTSRCLPCTPSHPPPPSPPPPSLSSAPQEIWPMILEKAFAKLAGSYVALKGSGGGYFSKEYMNLRVGAQSVMQLMTGSPDVTYTSIDTTRTDVAFRKMMFGRIRDGLSRQALITGGSNSKYCKVVDDSGQGGRKYGIVGSHAYSIIGAVKVGKTPLLHVRNPWGQTEWAGDWCDDDTRWTLSAIKQVNDDPLNGGNFVNVRPSFPLALSLPPSFPHERGAPVRTHARALAHPSIALTLALHRS